MVLIHLSSVQIVIAIALTALSLNADFSQSKTTEAKPVQTHQISNSRTTGNKLYIMLAFFSLFLQRK